MARSRLSYLLAVSALLIPLLACGDKNEGETVSPTPGESVYRNEALGFQLALPPALAAPAASTCQPSSSPTGDQVNLGSNILIKVSDADDQTAADASVNFLTGLGAQAENTSSAKVDGTVGVRTEYRLTPSGRFGIAIFVVRNTRLYTLVFEARDLTQCGGATTPALFDELVKGFKFLP